MKFKAVSIALAALMTAGVFAGEKCCKAVKESKTNFAAEVYMVFLTTVSNVGQMKRSSVHQYERI